jgi:glutaredoxin-related protein
VVSFRLFKPVRSEPLHDNSRKFLHISFVNKGINDINISNILNRKEVVKEIPPYFKYQSVPIVSYIYTHSIGRKMFSYKEALQEINTEEYLKNPLTCDCSHSPFQYNLSGHVNTGDLNIIQHKNLRKVISHGPKFREPQHINRKHNFKIIMECC